MKIEVLKPCGYCSGVTNAIGIALEVKETYPSKRVIILGQLVHNHHVENFLREKGIETIYDALNSPFLSDTSKDNIYIFTAHGHNESFNNLLDKRGIKYYDVTCPKVQLTHSKIKEAISSNKQVIYIGKANHPETIGALSISNDVYLYNDDFNFDLIKDDSPLVINQTTLNIKEIEKDYGVILKHIPNAIIAKEICPTTRLRQEALINADKDVDAILVVGDKNSSNTTRLLEIAKSSHPESYLKLISSLEDIDLKAISNKKHLLISSGASTPIELIDSIKNYLENNLR